MVLVDVGYRFHFGCVVFVLVLITSLFSSWSLAPWVILALFFVYLFTLDTVEVKGMGLWEVKFLGMRSLSFKGEGIYFTWPWIVSGERLSQWTFLESNWMYSPQTTGNRFKYSVSCQIDEKIVSLLNKERLHNFAIALEIVRGLNLAIAKQVKDLYIKEMESEGSLLLTETKFTGIPMILSDKTNIVFRGTTLEIEYTFEYMLLEL